MPIFEGSKPRDKIYSLLKHSSLLLFDGLISFACWVGQIGVIVCMFIQMEVSQPQWVSGVSAVGEQFSQCGTTAALGSFNVSHAVVTRPHAGTMLIQIETSRGGDRLTRP